jgi:hypothetical protein
MKSSGPCFTNHPFRGWHAPRVSTYHRDCYGSVPFLFASSASMEETISSPWATVSIVANGNKVLLSSPARVRYLSRQSASDPVYKFVFASSFTCKALQQLSSLRAEPTIICMVREICSGNDVDCMYKQSRCRLAAVIILHHLPGASYSIFHSFLYTLCSSKNTQNECNSILSRGTVL